MDDKKFLGITEMSIAVIKEAERRGIAGHRSVGPGLARRIRSLVADGQVPAFSVSGRHALPSASVSQIADLLGLRKNHMT